MTSRLINLFAATCLAMAGCAEEANYITAFEDIPGAADGICGEGGGVRLLAGFDENADNKLQMTEVDRMDSICSPTAEGPTGLLRVEDLPVGGRCLNGGAVVFSGVDSNIDGTLQDEEVMDATFVCNGTNLIAAFEACETDDPALVRTGTIVVHTEAELMALQGVECIRGNLVIDAYPGTNIEALASLIAVTNDFLIINSRMLQDVAGLRALRVVGGSFLLQNNPALTTVAGFDMLEDVITRMSLVGLGITDLSGLESLVNVTGTIEVLGNEDLTSLNGLHNIRTIEGLLIDNNDALTNLDALNQLEHVKGTIGFYRNDLISDVSLDSLQRVDNQFDVFESPAVRAINMPNLLLPGGIRIRDNEGLTTATFPNTIVVGGTAEFTRNEALTAVRFPSLGYTSGSFYFYINTSLTEVTAPQLGSIGGELYLRENPAFSDFSGLDSVRSLGTNLVLVDNDSIADVGLTALTTVNGGFFVWDNINLRTFDGLSSLRTVRIQFEVLRNARLCEPEISQLMSRITIGGETQVSGNCTSM